MLKQEGATTFPRPVIANREGKERKKKKPFQKVKIRTHMKMCA
jgi:hypothetical protein